MSWREIGRRTGIRWDTAKRLAREAGIQKPLYNAVITGKKLDWLAREGIEPAATMCSVEVMKTHRKHFLDKYGYVARNASLLNQTTDHVDTNIAMLENATPPIDWKSEEHHLWKLISHNSETLRKKIALFESVGASAELHHLLIKISAGKIKLYSSDKKYYADLRQAILEERNGIPRLLKHAQEITTHYIRLNGWTWAKEYFDAGENAAVTALSECKNRKNNPVAALVIMSAAVEQSIKKIAQGRAQRRYVTQIKA